MSGGKARGGCRRVAILGGGLGALTAAFELTESGEPLEITVYQLGWRLGGKGASGRNLQPGLSGRIEEHGLHVFSGLYDNAFRILRACYRELGRAPGQPLASWREAFQPCGGIVLQERFRGRWVAWDFVLPTNGELPGSRGAGLWLRPGTYLTLALDALRLLQGKPPPPRIPEGTGDEEPPREEAPERRTPGWLQAVRRVALSPRLWRPVLSAWGASLARRWPGVEARIEDDGVRRAWMVENFVYGNLRGLLEEDALRRGLDRLDGEDYRAWLGRYVCADSVDGQSLTCNSPLAWFLYDAQFSYVDGDLRRPDLAAGAAVRTLLRMALTWKGALLWKLQAGMGDVVFTPLYEVLRRRGVRFEFFHRVKQLHLSEDRRSIAAIRMARQAWLEGEQREYAPLVDVHGLPCWPSEPLYAQLREGEALRRAGVRFESYESPEVEERVLRAGEHFDEVVLGISLPGLPHVAGELMSADERWRRMVEEVKTVRTQGFQVWLRTPETGSAPAASPEPEVVGVCYHAGELNTYAQMGHLLTAEGWGARGHDVSRLRLWYFCGVLPEPAPETESAHSAWRHAHSMMAEHFTRLAPWASHPGRAGCVDWDCLVDERPEPAAGVARLEAQYFAPVHCPSDRFVQSVSGSTAWRLEPGGSGFSNLVLAGDWTRNGFNIGNAEATTLSGILAARALLGRPTGQELVGWGFLT